MKAFGERLKAARLAKKMTLVQCANALGITNPALSQWEQGKREPKYEMLIELCNLLGTTPNELLGFADAPRPSVRAGGNAVVAVGSNIVQNVGATRRRKPESS